VLRSPPACTAHGRETTGGSRPAGDEERRPAGRAHKLVALVHLEVAPAAAARRGRGVPLLHLPHDLHEVVDGAWQLERAVAAGEAVLGLGLFQERAEQRVAGAAGAHHEPLLLRADQHREAPRRRRLLVGRAPVVVVPGQRVTAPLQRLGQDALPLASFLHH
jgi:hypothetical protein